MREEIADAAPPTPTREYTARPTLTSVNLPSLPLGAILRACVPEVLVRLNKPATVWSALAVGVVTFWNWPGLKEQVAALIMAPSLGNLSIFVGLLLFGVLLYYTKPVGVP